ncbi:MAG: hypothetical protein CV087_17585 [Candidatus Brocadia sp. WS118]|nr:MAG: hypothetical protein CV087_17585 [Candidatus Brocadia sp. WS118]
MAKKKTTTVVEEDVTPEVDYKEIHDAKKLEDVVDPDTTKEEAPVEEKKEEEERIEFDPEQFKKEVTEEAGRISEERAQKIVEAASGSKDDPKEEDDELISPWKKEGRTPKDYEEVADWAVKKKEILDTRAAEAHKKEVEEQEKIAKESKEEAIKRFNDWTDGRLNDLYESGKLPKVIDPKNPDDEGVVAKKALFQTMLDVNLDRAKRGLPEIMDIKEIYYEHYKAPKKEVAGADAPVSPSTTPPGESSKDLDYNEIHNSRGIWDLFKKK